MEQENNGSVEQDEQRFERSGLQEGDYYFSPEGYLVFTEQYHLRRGYCCGNRCKHCPFGHEAVRKARG
ncbi:MAG: hypothetical protein IPL52_12205 [Flavobacteriales bacterium]|nr:hypothetical protein [Flavobacteriales bacterium]